MGLLCRLAVARRLLSTRVSLRLLGLWLPNHFDVRGIDDPAGLPLLAAIFPVYLLPATPVLNTIIRMAETEADLFCLNASREPDGFAEAIFKLSKRRKLQPGEWEEREEGEEIIFFNHPGGYNCIFAAMRWKAGQLK